METSKEVIDELSKILDATPKNLNQNNMKQTAVDWLLENLNSEPYSEEEFNYNSDCWDKAKEMEKKQIILAHGIKMKGVNNMKCVTGEQYYNETFKQQENETDSIQLD